MNPVEKAMSVSPLPFFKEVSINEGKITWTLDFFTGIKIEVIFAVMYEKKKKWKEIPIMKTKNVKVKTAKVLANVSLKLGKMSADSACCYIYHQPKMSEVLKKMKNF